MQSLLIKDTTRAQREEIVRRALSACGSTHACRDVLHLSFAVGLHQRSTCSPAAALSLRNSVTAVRQHADRRA